MNSTFMFGEDRFGADQQYGDTYRRLGFRRLDDNMVAGTITDAFTWLADRYDRPEFFNCFPTVDEAIRAVRPQMDTACVRELVAVFAEHECGTVTAEYRRCLERLADSHRLALVTNIWAPSTRCRHELSRAGVLKLFSATVFSSDIAAVKPAASLFQRALDELRVSAREAVMIGDSFRRDIAPAIELGMATVWITRAGVVPEGVSAARTATAASLLDVVVNAR